MGLVMLGKQDLAAGHAKLGGDHSFYPELLPKHILHRLGVGAPRMWKTAQQGGDDAIELKGWPLVEDHAVKLFRFEPGVVKAPFNGGQGKRCIVFASGKTLFLYSRDRHAIDQQRRRGIVIMCRDAKDAHQYCPRRFSCFGSMTIQPGRSRRAARLASKANGSSSTKYWIVNTIPAMTPANAIASRK